jgi:hypothetical protein
VLDEYLTHVSSEAKGHVIKASYCMFTDPLSPTGTRTWEIDGTSIVEKGCETAQPMALLSLCTSHGP